MFGERHGVFFTLPNHDSKTIVAWGQQRCGVRLDRRSLEIVVGVRQRGSPIRARRLDDVPAGTKVVTVRIVRSSDFKLYRSGPTPVIRGTAYRLSLRRAFLWT